jgi:hypothetical protein
MTIDANTGAFSWTPTEAQGGLTPLVTITVTDADSGNLIDSETFNVTVNDLNAAPAIISNGGSVSAELNATEGQTSVTTVTSTDGDLPANTLSYTIIGGADQALFSIDGDGNLTFNLAPDYSVVTDANSDGIYEVQVQVSDGTATDTQLIQVTVIEAYGAPIGVAVITESGPENSTSPAAVVRSVVSPMNEVLSPRNERAGPIGEEASEELSAGSSKRPTAVSGVDKRVTEELAAYDTATQSEGFDFARPSDSGKRSNTTVALHVQLRAALNSAFALSIPSQLLADPVRLLAEGLGFRNALDDLRENLSEETANFEAALRSGAFLATGLSIGYIAWLAKGGLMTASLVTSLPLWRILDPIPVLANMDDSEEDPDEEAESLASMLEDKQETDHSVANDDMGNGRSSIDAGEITP